MKPVIFSSIGIVIVRQNCPIYFKKNSSFHNLTPDTYLTPHGVHKLNLHSTRVQSNSIADTVIWTMRKKTLFEKSGRISIE